MKLVKEEAHVWCFNADQFSGKLDIYKAYLYEDEINKVNRFKFEKDRVICILSRGLLRLISSHYLGIEANNIIFKYGNYGKPDYSFKSSLKFNVSHSGKYIVLAFTKDSEIGVDVEHIKMELDVLSVAENFFSLQEIKSIKKFCDTERAEAFFRCWTRKEAFIKAKGSGLSFPLASFSMSLSLDNPKVLKTEWDTTEKNEWNLFSFNPYKDYVGALIVDKNVQNISYFDEEAFKRLF